jgi:hypothetical protein
MDSDFKDQPMRRIFSSLIAGAAALTVGAGDASAQVIGFKLGAAYANMSADELTSTRITGFSGGGHMRFGLGGRMGLQLELLSVTKGADFTRSAVPVTDSYRFEYVEIPVLLHIPLVLGTTMAPYVFGGGSAGIQVRCRVTTTAGDTIGAEHDCQDPRSPDLGLVGGGGLAFAMGPGAVIVEARYTAGMRSVFTDGGIDVRHRATSVMAGYEVPLGRSW